MYATKAPLFPVHADLWSYASEIPGIAMQGLENRQADQLGKAEWEKLRHCYLFYQSNFKFIKISVCYVFLT